MKTGDFVVTQYDDGIGGTVLYGIVVSSGPKTVTIRWESGLDNRIRHTELAAHGIRQKAPAEDDLATLRNLQRVAPLTFAKSTRANVDLSETPKPDVKPSDSDPAADWVRF